VIFLEMKPRLHLDFMRLAILSILFFTLGACAPKPAPTFFLPPTESLQLIPLPATQATATSSAIVVPTILVPTPTPPCTDNLSYIQDLTIPDGTNVSSGQIIDKQWLVTNSGTCDWDARYRLKLVSGAELGAAIEQALYPARAGTQATLRILFTAPSDAGTYSSAWQAFGPEGTAFGDTIYIQIVVPP
jgi:hypothetical protein